MTQSDDRNVAAEALKLLREKKWQESKALYERLIQGHPTESGHQFGYGYACMRLGQYDEALAALTKAIEAHPNYAPAYNALGWVHYKTQEWDKAVEAYEREQQLQEPSCSSLYFRAESLYKTARHSEAIQIIQRCLEQDPDYAHAKKRLREWEEKRDYDRAWRLMDEGRWSESKALFGQLLHVDPTFYGYLYGYGFVCGGLEEYEEALDALLKLRQTCPEFEGIHTTLGRVYYGLRQWDKAIEAYRRGSETRELDYKSLNCLAESLHHTGRTGEAIHTLERSIEKCPDQVYARKRLGEMYEEAGWNDEAIRTKLDAVKTAWKNKFRRFKK